MTEQEVRTQRFFWRIWVLHGLLVRLHHRGIGHVSRGADHNLGGLVATCLLGDHLAHLLHGAGVCTVVEHLPSVVHHRIHHLAACSLDPVVAVAEAAAKARDALLLSRAA